MSRFWTFKNLTDSEAELSLYGEIASERPWWDDSEMAVQNEFISGLNALNGKNVTVRINSAGGDVFAAKVILTNLKIYKAKHNARIVAQIDGLAASAATIPMTAGDLIKAPSYANIMIHDPMIGLMGYYNGEELQKAMDAWESIKESIINAYASRFNMDNKAIEKIMKTQTWMTALEAKEKGFVDEIMFEDKAEPVVTNNGKYLFINSVVHDLSKFNSIPKLSNYQPAIETPVIINKKEETKPMCKTVEELKNAYPDLVQQIVNSATEEGAKQERQRIKDIEGISNNIDPALVSKAKFEEPKNAQDLAFEAMKQNAVLGQQYLNNAADDNTASGTQTVGAVNGGQQPQKPQTIQDKFKNAASAFDLQRRGVKING